MDQKAIDMLIAAVKCHPILYSRNTAGMTSDQKNAIWAEISQQIDIPVEKCKAKWRNLRDSYLKSIKWRLELEAVGKLENYHAYKHEVALSFIGTVSKREGKRKGSPDVFKPKKKLKEDAMDSHIEDYSNDSSPPQDVEYLVIESETTEQETNVTDNEEEDGYCEREDEQFQEEITDEGKLSKAEVTKREPSFYEYKLSSAKDSSSIQQDDVSYRDTFSSDNPQTSAELDSWLQGIKETIMTFPKLERAKVKKEINKTVSDFEIQYLESLGGDS